MAEKRVSVRLVASGGKLLRSELEGVGAAGQRTFGQRIPRDVERANAKLAAFARSARLAATAAAAAATTAAVAITRSTVAAAQEIRQFAQMSDAGLGVFQRWSAATATVGISQEKLADVLKDVNDRVGDFLATGGGPMADFFENIAPRVGVTADQFARLSGPEALLLYVSSLERAGLGQKEMTFYLEAMASDTTQLLPLLRDGGAEMARLGAQAQALGAVLDEDAVAAMARAEMALVSMDQVFTGIGNKMAVALTPALERAAQALVAAASDTGLLGRALTALADNLGRFLIYGTTFVGLMAGKWVLGVGLATAATVKLVGALTLLKGALVRTGVGALIVGAGELVHGLTGVVGAAKNATEAGKKLQTALDTVAGAMGEEIRQSRILASALTAGEALSRDTALTKLKEARARQENVKQAMAETRALIVGGEQWRKITERLNLERARLSSISPDGNQVKLTQAEEYEQIEARIAAFLRERRALLDFEDEFKAQLARTAGNIAALETALQAQGQAETTLSEAITTASDERAGDLDKATASADRFTQALKRVQNIPDPTSVELRGFEAVNASLRNYAEEAAHWGEGLGDTLVTAFGGAESAFRSFVETGKLDFKALVSSILADLAALQLRTAVLGPVSTALAGAFGFGGAPSVTATVSHGGGVVGLSGHGRRVPAGTFAAAPRMHAGGWVGLRPDEVPTILQRGERVLNKNEAARGAAGGVSRLEVELSGDLVARVLQEARDQSVTVTRSMLNHYDRFVAPKTVARVARDGRVTG